MDFEAHLDQREIQSLAREFGPRRSSRMPLSGTATPLPEGGLRQARRARPDGRLRAGGYGGAGADFLSYILVLEELSRADAGVGVTVGVHTSAVTRRSSASAPTSSDRASCHRLRAERRSEPCADGDRGGSDAGATRRRPSPTVTAGGSGRSSSSLPRLRRHVPPSPARSGDSGRPRRQRVHPRPRTTDHRRGEKPA